MNEQISIWAHEGAMIRADKTNKRLWALCVILVCMLLGTNLAWLYYEKQFEVQETETTTVTQEAESDGDIIMNNGGDVSYGK